MAYSVEGPWKQFTFKLIEEEDIPKVNEHLQSYFLRDEKTSELAGYTDDYGADFGKLVAWIVALGEKLSFIAIDTATGEVAAVRLTYIHTTSSEFSHFKFQSTAMKKLLRVFAVLDEKPNAFKHYGIDHYAMFMTASVDKNYRNQGLASEMYVRSFALLRDRQIPVVQSFFTSPYTRKCGKKFNFEELSTLRYKGWRDDNGELVLPGATDDDHAVMVALKL